jgi:integrase
LFNPKQVMDYILSYQTKAKKPATNGFKKCLIQTYATFCKFNQIPFDRPKGLRHESPIPLIPTMANVEKIINNASRKYVTIFRILTETAVEGEELHQTHRNQIDPEQGTISVNGCKGHTNGVYKLKTQTAEMLRQYLAKHPEPYPFPESRAMSLMWQQYRKKASRKLCEPELLKIQMKNLRNYAGAIFYNAKGKDPIATQRFMRHKKLDTTQQYLQGIMLYEENEEYTTKTVQLGTPTTIREITELSDAGYQYYTEANGYKLFRKRK